MKKAIYVCLLLLLPSTVALAQEISGYGGLGVQYYRADEISEYLDYAAPGSALPGSFATSIDFILGTEVDISNEWALGLEYNYMIRSATGSTVVGSQQVDVSYSLPLLTVRRLIVGNGYSWRFGGAVGYHFGNVSTSSPYTSQAENYSASGLGFKVDGSLDTELDSRLYARFGVDAQAEFIGDLKSKDGSDLTYLDSNSDNMHPVNMHLFGVGVLFGLVYHF